MFMAIDSVHLLLSCILVFEPFGLNSHLSSSNTANKIDGFNQIIFNVGWPKKKIR